MAFGLDLGNLIVHLRADDSQYNRILTSAEKRLTATANKLNAIGRTMTMRVTLPIVAMGLASTKAFASFDDAMTKSLAIMKDVTPEIREEMESLAISISKKSVTSATELAKSYFYLASAGLSLEQQIKSLAVVERFAVAGAFDMALATDLVTDAQSALGLTVKDATKNMENMERITDVLVAANTLANASTQQFSEALMRAGPAMKAYGISVEEGTAVLAAYADQGKKGAEGGELFGRMLRLMIKGFIDNNEAWVKFNVSITDAEDNLQPLADTVRGLTDLLGGMSVIQKATTLDLLGFQARSQQAILPLLGLGDAIENYYEKLLEANKITKEITEKQLKSFSSQMKITWNNVKAVAMSIGRILSPYILKLNELVVKATEFWDNLNESIQQSVVVYGLLAAVIGPVLIATGLLLKTLAFMITVVKMLIPTIVALIAILTGPLAVVLLLVAAAYTLRAAWSEGTNAIKENLKEMADAFKDTYDYLADTIIGKFLIWMAEGWQTTFQAIAENHRDFIANIAGTSKGVWQWMKAVKDGIVDIWTDPWITVDQAIKDMRNTMNKADDAFGKGFDEGATAAEKRIGELKEKIGEDYKETTTYMKAFGQAAYENLEDLMSAVKIQFGKDADAIIALIESKTGAFQKIPISPHEQLRLQMDQPETRLAVLQEEQAAVKAIVAEETKRVEILTVTNATVQAMLNALDFELSMLGKTSEERERAISLSQFQVALQEMIGEELFETIEGQTRYNELMDEYVAKLDLVIERTREISEIRDRSLKEWEAVGNAIDVWITKSMNWGQRLGDVLVNAFDRAAESFAGMLMKEEVDWKAFGRMFVKELLVMIVKLRMAVALKAILGFWGGLGTDSGVTPGSAADVWNPSASPTMPSADIGGHVERTGLAVIHKGEEIRTKTEVENDRIGGITVNITNNARVNVEVEENQDERTVNLVISAMATHGPMRRAVSQIGRRE